MVKTAVIMAAGLGTRFGNKTGLIPKGFIDVKGKPMVVRSIEILLACGIERIIIGTGYKKEAFEKLVEKYPQIECCYSERYAETNSMWTLYNCRDVIGADDFILLESDLIYEKKAIISLQEDVHPDILLISDEVKFQDQYFVEHDESGNLINCSVERNELVVCGEFVGIQKLSATFYKKMCENYGKIAAEQPKLGYEYELMRMSRGFFPVYVLKIVDLKWYEIDDEADLFYAEKNIIF